MNNTTLPKQVTALGLTEIMKEKGIDGDVTLRKVVLISYLAHAIIDISDEVERDFRKVGNYKMDFKHKIKSIRRDSWELVKHAYPKLTEEGIGELTEHLDDLETILYEWANIKKDSN